MSCPICVEYSIYVLEQRSYLIPPNELQASFSNMMSLLWVSLTPLKRNVTFIMDKFHSPECSLTRKGQPSCFSPLSLLVGLTQNIFLILHIHTRSKKPLVGLIHNWLHLTCQKHISSSYCQKESQFSRWSSDAQQHFFQPHELLLHWTIYAWL